MLTDFVRRMMRCEGDAGNGGSGSGADGGQGAQGSGNAGAGSGTVLGGDGSSSSSSSSSSGTTFPDWASGLPEELKSAPSLSTYKDLPSFVKSALEAEKLIGKKGIIKPGEGATPEEMGKYYEALGRPEKPEGYGLQKPSDWPAEIPLNDAYPAKAQQIFHKHGLTPEQAKGVFGDWLSEIKNEGTDLYGSSKQQVEQGIQALKNEWGGEEKYNAKVETAKMAVREFGGDDLVNFLNDTGLGNHPTLIKAFANAGLNLREDTFEGGGQGGGAMTAERAKAEVERLNNDPEFTKILYSNKIEDRDRQKEAKLKIEKLYQIAYPTFT